MKQILISSIVVILVLFAFTIGPWILMYVYTLFQENPPKPTYTYGEFPFHLEYEVDGQTVTVDDTVIVEFAGFEFSQGIGSDKTIKWRQTLASGKEEIILFENGESERVHFAIKYEEYSREDKLENNDYIDFTPSVIKEVDDGRYSTSRELTDLELFIYYEIKLTEFYYGESTIK